LLAGPGPYTVFAPNDAAFSASRFNHLLAGPVDTAKLDGLMRYHIVPGRLEAANLADGLEVVTLQGERLRFQVVGNQVRVNGAKIVTSDIPASNGVLHVIDTVLEPSDLAEPTRIQFAPGATATTIQDFVLGKSLKKYVLRAMAGQTMSVRIDSPRNDVLLTIYSADGANILKRYVDDQADWTGELPATSDYIIEAVSVGESTSFSLTVEIEPLAEAPQPVRIEFAPGATSATIQDRIQGRFVNQYILGALAGQTMSVNISSPNNDVLLTIYSADGANILKRYVDGRADWTGTLPETTDYIIEAVSVGDTTDFTLSVVIEPLSSLPEPVRIQFAPGSTSATVNGAVVLGERDRYVLSAMRDQLMTVQISSLENNAAFTIVGPYGGVLPGTEEGADATRWDGILGATGDYTISVGSIRGNATYSLTVTILPPRPAETVRIQFAPGANSATVHDTIYSGETKNYVLRAMAGQTMTVSVSSPRGDVPFAILGLQDGNPYKRIVDESMIWTGVLPLTQDYQISVTAYGPTTTFTLKVIIE
jgi:hypothetical protein